MLPTHHKRVQERKTETICLICARPYAHTTVLSVSANHKIHCVRIT